MQHDIGLRAIACAIYDTVYPSPDWAPVAFDEAERLGTIHYRQALEAARRARVTIVGDGETQLALI